MRRLLIVFPLLISMLTVANTSGYGQEIENNRIYYEVSWDKPQTHTFSIKMKFRATNELSDKLYEVLRFNMPSWRPGRYVEQQYAAGISNLRFSRESGKPLSEYRTGISNWRIGKVLKNDLITVEYDWYANVMDAGSSYLGTEQAYINGSNMFLYLEHCTDSVPITVTFPSLPESWKVATALTKTASHNTFTAASYHELVDCPTIFSPKIKTLEFEEQGVTYYMHFQGNYLADAETEDSLLARTQRIVRVQRAIFDEFVGSEYHFIYQMVPYRLRHAVEHKQSAMFVLPEGVIGRVGSLGGITGITAHELFHHWNVKHLRPFKLNYSYNNPPLTDLHWFTEGVTQYYAELTQFRANLIDRETFFKRAAANIGGMENNYASKVISPSESSYNSWLSNSAYGNPNLRISYYTQGQWLGLLMDLIIRAESNGKSSLDDLFSDLWKQFYRINGSGRYMAHQLKKYAVKLGNERMEALFEDHIHGTKPLNYETFLEPFGLELISELRPDQTFELIGISQWDEINVGLYLNKVIPGSDASEAGLADKDIVLSINGKEPSDFNAEKWFKDARFGKKLRMNVFRGSEQVPVTIIYSGVDGSRNYELRVKKERSTAQKALLEAWLPED